MMSFCLKLLDEQSCAKLPALYSNEVLGLNALAQVKFFSPYSGWIWYASEFDGHDIFFGLIVGYEIEFSYFRLTELRKLRGPLGSHIERDKYYQPRSLCELREKHRKDRSQA